MQNKRQYVDPKPAVPAIPPTPSARKRLRRLLLALGWLGRLLLRRTVHRLDVIGREHLGPGPYLILTNHATPLDPLVLTFGTRRNIQFLVTEPYLADRPVARFTAWLGQIPKRKLDNDTKSIRTLKKWIDLGVSVGLFPEGQFAWDGRSLPIQPGLRQLVLYLDVPVITMRIQNGDRLWPAWASHPRKTSLRIEIDAPVRFTAADDIERRIAERIRVEPHSEGRLRPPAHGKNLAHGLARFYRFCPACGADGQLRDEGNHLHCQSCRARYRVDVDHALHPIGQTPDAKRAASDRIAEIGRRLRDDAIATYALTESFASRGPVELFDATKARWVRLDEGALSVTEGSLRMSKWSLAAAEILGHTLDWGDLILIRTRTKRFAVRFPEDSRALWTDVLDHLIANARAPGKGTAP